MRKQRKVLLLICSVLIMVMCVTIGYMFVKTNNSQAVNYVNKQLGIEVNGVVTIRITDDLPASGIWKAKDQEATLSKVLSWLTHATLYKGQIPEANFSETVQFGGNINSSCLTINCDGHSILIQPANYLFKEENGNIAVKCVEGVVMIEKDGKKSYIEADNLYKWLKNNEWKPEFIPN